MNSKSLILLLFILLIGAFFRFFGINWDQGFHLHPDERFLTMVGVASRIPQNFLIYLSPSLSPLNPINNNFPFFVYGIFPVTLVKLAAVFFNFDNYTQFTIVGRYINALFDIGTLILVFLTTKLLSEEYHLGKKTPFLAALFYAIAVFPIQLSHFFTVDLFLNFFSFFSIYLLLTYIKTKNLFYVVLAGVAFGIAMASKLSALAILPLIGILIYLVHGVKKSHLASLLIVLGIFSLASYISLRLTDPYVFQSPNPFNILPNIQFVESITTLNSYNNPLIWYPPGIQWLNKIPILFALSNMFFFGLGPLYFLLTALGLFKLLQTRKGVLLTLTAWVILFFLFQSVQHVKTMRYFILLYPFFAIFAAEGYTFFWERTNKVICGFLGILLFIWPLMFFSIYTRPHTRVEASYWIRDHIPAGSTILTEYWDDPLPLDVPGVMEKQYTIVQLHVFDPDTPLKWKEFNSELSLGNYLILSSNRGWGSIPTVPNRYPRMSQFYRDLLAGKLPYKKVAEFTSYPSLSYMGIPITISDDSAEEAFTVFDHPKVLIFKKQN